MPHPKKLDTMTLGDIAANIPGATAVFRRHDLDFCCAGNQSFRDAITRKGLNHEAVLSELNSLAERNGQTDEVLPHTLGINTTTPELISHIISRYHDVHRQQLPELIRLAARVEKVHAERRACPTGLEAHLKDMFQELLIHMEKEEETLFPMLLSEGSAHVKELVSAMENEHEDHGRALLTIRELTNGIQLPENACNTWRALYQGLSQLEEDLIQHIHLENNILFTR